MTCAIVTYARSHIQQLPAVHLRATEQTSMKWTAPNVRGTSCFVTVAMPEHVAHRNGTKGTPESNQASVKHNALDTRVHEQACKPAVRDHLVFLLVQIAGHRGSKKPETAQDETRGRPNAPTVSKRTELCTIGMPHPQTVHLRAAPTRTQTRQ